MKPLNHPLIAFVLVFLAGLVCGFYVVFPYRELVYCLLGLFLLFLLFWFFCKKGIFPPVVFSAIAFPMFFLLGVFVVKFHSPVNNPGHYLHFIDSENRENKTWLIVGEVVKALNPSRYSDKYILEVKRLGAIEVDGEILLNLDKSSFPKTLKVDDRVVLKTGLEKINPPRNPHQFDYGDFMANRGVYRQVYVSPREILVFKTENSSLYGFAEKARDKITAALKENGFRKEHLAMIQGLMLGQTDEISEETYNNYTAAGVVHILSVSGLHVGIVLLIFNFLLKPLEFNRFGKILKVVLLIVLLWGFALLAGFSAPVVRSVAMFSLVAIGLNWRRKTNLINILFMSLLAVLLIEPRFIFEVGFQLSYLAVFAIVALQPKFHRLYASQNKVVKYILGLITVSIAAQIGITALGLFYFHQFPGISIFANLLVIPATVVIMALAMLVILLALLGILPGFLADILGFCIDALNGFVAWCANQDALLFQNVSFSVWEMLAVYLFVFCLILAAWGFNYKKLMACLVCAALFLGVSIYQERKVLGSREFLVFHKNRKTMFGFKNGGELKVFSNFTEGNLSREYSIRNYAIGEGVDEISSDSLRNIYKADDGVLLVVDSSGVYELPELQNALVLLRDSPQINLDRLIETLHPKTIIADGSNYHSYVGRWRETCSKTGTPFHWTNEDGAFVVGF